MDIHPWVARGAVTDPFVMSVEETCRLCRNNLMVKGVITNSRNLFTVHHKEKPLHQRFRDVGVSFQKRPGVYSCRICVKCYRKLVKVEGAMRTLKIWQTNQQMTETEKTVETDLEIATRRRHTSQGNEGNTSHILPILSHVATQTDPAERRSLGALNNVRSTATQARVPSRDCGMCTLTFPLDSPLLFLQPTRVKRPSKRPRLSLTDEEEGPSECSLSMVVHEPEDAT